MTQLTVEHTWPARPHLSDFHMYIKLLPYIRVSVSRLSVLSTSPICGVNMMRMSSIHHCNTPGVANVAAEQEKDELLLRTGAPAKTMTATSATNVWGVVERLLWDLGFVCFLTLCAAGLAGATGSPGTPGTGTADNCWRMKGEVSMHSTNIASEGVWAHVTYEELLWVFFSFLPYGLALWCGIFFLQAFVQFFSRVLPKMDWQHPCIGRLVLYGSIGILGLVTWALNSVWLKGVDGIKDSRPEGSCWYCDTENETCDPHTWGNPSSHAAVTTAVLFFVFLQMFVIQFGAMQTDEVEPDSVDSLHVSSLLGIPIRVLPGVRPIWNTLPAGLLIPSLLVMTVLSRYELEDHKGSQLWFGFGVGAGVGFLFWLLSLLVFALVSRRGSRLGMVGDVYMQWFRRYYCEFKEAQ